MRRAIAATVVGGLMLGGTVTPAVAATRSGGKGPGKTVTAAPGKPTARVVTAATAMKTVVYAGYEFQVPASWPVYRLDEHPQTCVRYDVHAVYLGTPGPNMRCPAGLVGRTQTVSIMPGKGNGPDAAGNASSAASPAAGGTELQRLSAVHATVRQDAVSHELKVALGAAAPRATVLGTYGSSASQVERVLSTLRRAPAGSKPSVQSAPAQGQAASAAGAGAGRARFAAARSPLASRRPSAPATTASATPDPTYTDWRGVPAGWPVQVVSPPPTPGAPQPTPTPSQTPPTQPTPTPSQTPPTPPTPVPSPSHPVNGFDTCTAPSVSTMHTWRSKFAAAGVYIGGANAACAGGNLTAGWVRSVTSMGWGLLPTYVGPQAPCWGFGGSLISPAHAAAEGNAAALDAVSDARSLHLPTGSPIYYDMEAYRGSTSCTNAVLTFLGAWDRRVAAMGYVTGVYSSAASGIADMQRGAVGKTHGFTPPTAIWIALWNGVASLSDGKLAWPLADRSKQYAGDVKVTVGGITIDVDRDYVGGPMVR